MADHLLTGTYRKDRHGPRAANVAVMPTPTPDWTPTEDDLAGLDAGARAALERWLTDYTFSPSEAVLITNVAHLQSRLASLRRRLEADADDPDRLRVVRLEAVLVARVASVLLQLKL